MKRKRKILLTAGVCAILLSGCGSSLPDMTEDQVDAIGEYAAITLLKYDANSKSRLVDMATMEEVQKALEEQRLPEEQETNLPSGDITEPEQQPAVIDNTGNAGNEMADSLEEFLELPEGMRIACTGYEVAQSYQEEGDMYFALEASAGKQLLVLSFALDNQSDEDRGLRFIDLQNSYRVTVNGDYTRTALTTMLDNDLATFMGTVKAGESRTLVLLLEIDPDKVPQVNTITLNFKNTQTSYTLQIV